MLTAEEALDRLKKGNERFVNGQTQHLKLLTHQQRAEMAESQEPFAIVLGCSDSRVPAEMVFDQGLGDLFVIRVAGNGKFQLSCGDCFRPYALRRNSLND